MRKEYIFFSCREEEEEEEVPRKRLSSKGDREGEGREKNESESVAVGWIGRRKRSGGFWVAVAVLGLWRGEKIGPVERSWAGNCWNFFWFEAVETPRKRAEVEKGERVERAREGRRLETMGGVGCANGRGFVRVEKQESGICVGSISLHHLSRCSFVFL